MNKQQIAERKERRRTEALRLLSKNFSPKYIAKELKVHICNVYRYKQEHYDITQKIRLDKFIEETIKSATDELDLTVKMHELTYKEVCSVYRRYKSHVGYGFDKVSKINQIVRYLMRFYDLKIAPTKDKSKIKRAFYRQARKCHPDLNKNYDKNGKEFQELYNCYQNILNSLF